MVGHYDRPFKTIIYWQNQYYIKRGQLYCYAIEKET